MPTYQSYSLVYSRERLNVFVRGGQRDENDEDDEDGDD